MIIMDGSDEELDDEDEDMIPMDRALGNSVYGCAYKVKRCRLLPSSPHTRLFPFGPPPISSDRPKRLRSAERLGDELV
jgi:hypothetical protein